MRCERILFGMMGVVVTAVIIGCGTQQQAVLEPRGDTPFERALDYEEQQEFGLAAKEYLRVLKENPNDSRAYVNLGLIYDREGRESHAVRCWQRALEVNPNDARALNLLGNVWKDQQQYLKAIAYYRRALEADPDYADVHWNLAAAYRHLEMKREAATHYRRFIAVASAHERRDVDTAETYLAELRKEGEVFDEIAPSAPALAEAPADVAPVIPPAEAVPPAVEETAPVAVVPAPSVWEECPAMDSMGPCAVETELTAEEDLPAEPAPDAPEDVPEVKEEKSTDGEATTTQRKYDGTTEDELREWVAEDLDRAWRERHNQARAEE
ncbi:MAG TPA: tetratricopeptide repeat protein [Planctomycetota bacterium]|nr:tetratricopeptide repeat protein [Planctomycetota bacterium]